ncbi:MAG: potassium transporter TrkA, partial [Sphingomonas sp.]|nr:potassium transporter TrkA [Sphingomonas sp.]
MKPGFEELLTLRRNSRVTGWFQLGWRIAAVFALLAILVFFHWIERDGLRDNHDGVVSFADVVYFTM